MDTGQFDYTHYNQAKGTFDWNLLSHEFISSHRLNRIFGFYSQHRISYIEFSQTFHPEDKPIWDYTIRNSYPRESIKCELRILLPDKTVRWIKIFGKITYNEKRMPVRIHATAQDITELKALFTELKESEEKFRLLADSMPQLIWTSDAKGRFNFFNKAVFNFSGFNYEQMQKKGWTSLVYPEDLEKSKKVWEECIATGKEFVIEHRLRNFIGEYRWHQNRAIPQKDSQGKLQMWVGTITDIHSQSAQNSTAQQEMEKKIQQRTQSLVEENVNLSKTNSELREFAYVASHDLQEPLRKIITFSNRIQQQYKEAMPEGSKAYLDKIISSSQRMTRLIEDLLNFSMIAGSEEQFVKTDLNEVLSLVISDFEESIREKKAQVTYDTLPVISVNPVQMSQLFHNLISNALKFSKESEPPVISISMKHLGRDEIKEHPELSEGPDYIEIIFRDNGIGFEQQYADKAFTIFQRLNHDQKYKGTGIGLALCKKITENHHGTITAESAPGKGSSFHIILPVADI